MVVEGESLSSSNSDCVSRLCFVDTAVSEHGFFILNRVTKAPRNQRGEGKRLRTRSCLETFGTGARGASSDQTRGCEEQTCRLQGSRVSITVV